MTNYVEKTYNLFGSNWKNLKKVLQIPLKRGII